MDANDDIYVKPNLTVLKMNTIFDQTYPKSAIVYYSTDHSKATGYKILFWLLKFFESITL